MHVARRLNRALVTILYRGGLRIAEALALKASDIDPDRGTVRILRGKGAKSRTIGLEPGAMAAVQRWMDARKGGHAEAELGRSRVLVPHRLLNLVESKSLTCDFVEPPYGIEP